MPLLYGEGVKAFTRLQEEIVKTSNDQTILTWDRGYGTDEILAPSVSHFQLCGNIRPNGWRSGTGTYEMTKRGLQIPLRCCYIAEDNDPSKSYEMKDHLFHAVVLLLDCLDGMKPGNYIAIKVEKGPRYRDWHKDTTVDISLFQHTMIYIPYQQLVWQLRPGTRQYAVGNARRKDFILFRPGESSGIEPKFPVPIIVDAAALHGTFSQLEGHPNTAWDMTGGDSGRYSTYLPHLDTTDKGYSSNLANVGYRHLCFTDSRGNMLVLALVKRGWAAWPSVVHWHAIWYAKQRASEKVIEYVNTEVPYEKWRRIRLPIGTSNNDTLRLSGTEKLYVQFDPTSEETGVGTYMTLRIVSETRWSLSETTIRDTKRVLKALRMRRRAAQFVFWLLVLPVFIVPVVIEVMLDIFFDVFSSPFTNIAHHFYEWLVAYEF
ncbi:hypothetical protein HII31_06350 [Pseudocercospora fuligena]|uniref:Uncharacterized protein n=1 Tax=Pseudocercospora fuligena TaxID=685502 RepID=A0A8H6RJK3_9PEZI|nr:hypothetical protein HII31_06350 [Pseudocercospora fuligena]